MFPSTQLNTADLRSALAHSQVQQTSQSAGAVFMKFDYKTGNFYYGQEAVEITGDEIVVNVASFKHGWTIWADGRPHKTAVSFTQPLPMEPDPIGDNYAAESRSFEARFADDDSLVLQLDINSYGGRKGCDQLLNEIRMKAMTEGDNFLFPVVKLTSESYKAKTGGTIHNPVFEVVNWMDEQGNLQTKTEQLEAPAEVKEEPAAPVRRRRKA